MLIRKPSCLIEMCHFVNKETWLRSYYFVKNNLTKGVEKFVIIKNLNY